MPSNEFPAGAPPGPDPRVFNVQGFLHKPDSPAWVLERGEGGSVTIHFKGASAPLIFDKEHFEMFLKECNQLQSVLRA